MTTNFLAWPTVLGYTQGNTEPNLVWCRELPSGKHIEIWKNESGPTYTATLLTPDETYKPGSLYLSEQMSETMEYVRFSDFAELNNTGWFPA